MSAPLDAASFTDSQERETSLHAAFVRIADTLADDFETGHLLEGLIRDGTRIFGVEVAALTLTGSAGVLELGAVTDPSPELEELLRLDRESGPTAAAFASGTVILVDDLDNEDWVDFATAARGLGYHATYVFPLRLRVQTIGTLTLLASRPRALHSRDAAAIQALADATTIAILQDRLLSESNTLTDQLHEALKSRIVIEQAKGIVSESESVTVEEAFTTIRNYSRTNNITVRSVAEAIVNRELRLRVG